MTIDQAMQIATQHHQAGQLPQAMEIYRMVLASQPNHADAMHLLGVATAQQRDTQNALILIQRAIAGRPAVAGYYVSLAEVHRRRGEFDQAIISARRAIELAPDQADGHANLGAALRERGDLDESTRCLRRAIELRPAHAEAHNSLGMIHSRLKRFEQASAAFQQALRLRPDFAEAHSNLGNIFAMQGQLDEAIACFCKSVELQPAYADAHSNLGNVFMELGKVDDAITAYRRAIATNPDFAEAHFHLAFALLLVGDFQQGWEEYEWRWKTKGLMRPRAFSQPQWHGDNLRGQTILLHAEQGFGDSLQFVRYAPLVAEKNGRVILECPPELSRLFASVSGVQNVIAAGKPLPEFDIHCPLASLPLALHTQQETIPHAVPYLGVPSVLLDVWRARINGSGDGLKVGVVWAGNPDPPNRSMSFSMLEPLLSVPGVRFYSLQKQSADAQAGTLSNPKLLDLTSGFADFADTAALIAHLDLIISIDTAVTHLAGALGKQTWLMLPFAPDWRWRLNRIDCDWYPMIELFRQPHRGDWNSVIQTIKTRLHKLVEI